MWSILISWIKSIKQHEEKPFHKFNIQKHLSEIKRKTAHTDRLERNTARMEKSMNRAAAIQVRNDVKAGYLFDYFLYYNISSLGGASDALFVQRTSAKASSSSSSNWERYLIL